MLTRLQPQTSEEDLLPVQHWEMPGEWHRLTPQGEAHRLILCNCDGRGESNIYNVWAVVPP